MFYNTRFWSINNSLCNTRIAELNFSRIADLNHQCRVVDLETEHEGPNNDSLDFANLVFTKGPRGVTFSDGANNQFGFDDEFNSNIA